MSVEQQQQRQEEEEEGEEEEQQQQGHDVVETRGVFAAAEAPNYVKTNRI